MKKIILGLLFCGFISTCIGNKKEPIKVRDGVNTQLADHITIQRRLKNALWVINDSIDYILTAKGAVKTLILLTPFMVLYCKYFDKDPIQDLVNKIIQSVGKAEEVYEMQREIGKTKAFWDMVSTQPWSALSVTAKKILDKTVYGGLPFMAGVLVKFGLGAK